MMTGLVLLAAGASTRLGQPKQELVYNGSTLLRRAIEAAMGSVCSPVVLVLGAQSKVSLPESIKNPLTIVHNPGWEKGMGSSIRCGLQSILAKEPAVDSCIFMVCDQPFVTSSLLNKLVQTRQESNKEIVACAYKDTLGTPVLFDSVYFSELLQLTGREGAKKVVLKYKDAVAPVPFPQGAIDIDTAEDYASLIQTTSSSIDSLL